MHSRLQRTFSALSLLEALQAKKGDWVIQTASNGAIGKIMAILGIENILSTSDANWKQAAKNILARRVHY